MVSAPNHLYAVTRKSGIFVLAAGPEFDIVAHNKFESDDSDFNGSPAISNGRLFLRSNRFLYCVGL
jgi:outer membrane protein assembly factor BamB